MLKTVDVAIIGAGTAGLYALSEVRRAKKSFVLIDKGPLGTTCARIGCMPSKVALHAAELWAIRKEQAAYGIQGTEQLSIDRTQAWKKVRELRDYFADSAADDARQSAGEHLIMGRAHFIKPTLISVNTEEGEQQIRAKSVIIAVGSRPVMPDFLKPYVEHCLTTDELFEQEQLPSSLGVLGLGAIGLEMGLAMKRLGVEVVGADMAESIGGINDPEVKQCALESLGQEFPMHLGAEAKLEAADRGVYLVTEKEKIQVDKVLVALGRRSNLDQLNLAEAGFELTEKGLLDYDPQTMQVKGHDNIFVIGDANGQRTLMHEAADEGAMAGYNASRDQAQRFERNVPIAIAFTQPDIVSVGERFDDVEPEKIVIGSANTGGNGRARILSDEEGVLRIYACKETGRLLGVAGIGPRMEHIAQFMALALEQKLTADELLQAPYYHPVVEEMVQAALRDIAKQLKLSDLPRGLKAA